MSDEQNARINEVFRIKGHGREILTDDDIDWFVFELEKCREGSKKLNIETENAKDACSAKGACMKAALNQLKIRTQELKECKAEVDTLSIAIAGVGGAFEKQRRHRKWALKEAKRLKAILRAMLAIGRFVIRQ